MLLHITHETSYDYRPGASVAQHLCTLHPMSDERQQLLDFELLVEPQPARVSRLIDGFGNVRHFFELPAAHERLSVTARSTVQTQQLAAPESHMAWEDVREWFRYAPHKPYDPAAEFVFDSPRAGVHPDFAAYAQTSFAPGRSSLEATRDLMQRIHRDFSYDQRSTQVNTPARQALAQRRGVCQDFAHIAIACLRSLGLPARYVSGYLLTQSVPGQPRMLGADASHAWFQAYLPDLPDTGRWWDFDPTNDRDGWQAPGEDYVTVAVGRDFSDVSPIRGVIHGGAQHTLTVGVTVQA